MKHVFCRDSKERKCEFYVRARAEYVLMVKPVALAIVRDENKLLLISMRIFHFKIVNFIHSRNRNMFIIVEKYIFIILERHMYIILEIYLQAF